MGFSGSYLKDDIEFLIKLIDMRETSINEKETLIQSKKVHYSEMLSPEYRPTDEYLNIFYEAFELNKLKVAKNILTLSNFLHNSFGDNFVLVSLLRAGVPIGVVLKRTLRDKFNINIVHYGVSIIRDRGLDENALKFITKKHSSKEVIFIDGWTGKGVIGKELKKSIEKFNQKYNKNISNKLYVLSDISGKADFSATNEDYLIPSSALNSTISGLVSRSILNRDFISENDFHGCKYYDEFSENDLSLWYMENLMSEILKIDEYPKKIITQNKNLEKSAKNSIEKIKTEFNIKNINHIKPGIGESTRVLLRRVPYAILVQDKDSIEVKHILKLASEREVKVIEDKKLLFRAVGIIKEKKETK